MVERFSPVGPGPGTWTDVSNPLGAPQRGGCVACFIPWYQYSYNSSLDCVVIDGDNRSIPFISKQTDVYFPTTNTWMSVKLTFKPPLSYATALTRMNGTIDLFGGYDLFTPGAVSTIWTWTPTDPGTVYGGAPGNWSVGSVPTMNTPRNGPKSAGSIAEAARFAH